MSNHNYPRRLLDDAIDRAVHDLVQADPRPGFRRRVMTKVNAPTKRSAWAARFLLPAGAMAAVVLLALWLRPEPSPVTVAPATQVAEQRPTPATQPQAPAAATGPALSERSESRGPALSERSESKGPALSERSESKGPVKLAVARATPSRRQPPVQFNFGPPSNRVAAASVTEGAGATGAVSEPFDEAAGVLTELPPVRISPIELKPILIKPIELKPIGVGSSSTPH